MTNRSAACRSILQHVEHCRSSEERWPQNSCRLQSCRVNRLNRTLTPWSHQACFQESCQALSSTILLTAPDVVTYVAKTTLSTLCSLSAGFIITMLVQTSKNKETTSSVHLPPSTTVMHVLGCWLCPFDLLISYSSSHQLSKSIVQTELADSKHQQASQWCRSCVTACSSCTKCRTSALNSKPRQLLLVSRVIGFTLAVTLRLAVLALVVTPWLWWAGFYASPHSRVDSQQWLS